MFTWSRCGWQIALRKRLIYTYTSIIFNAEVVAAGSLGQRRVSNGNEQAATKPNLKWTRSNLASVVTIVSVRFWWFLSLTPFILDRLFVMAHFMTASALWLDLYSYVDKFLYVTQRHLELVVNVLAVSNRVKHHFRWLICLGLCADRCLDG